MPIDAGRFRALFPTLCGLLTDAALAPVLESFRPRPFAEGEQLCRQGAHAARALFILRGEVELRVSATDVTATLGILEPGRWTNAIPLIEPGQAEFDVFGRTAGSAVEMTYGDFLALRREHPHTARVFLGGLISDLSSRLRASELAVGPTAGTSEHTSTLRRASGWLGGATFPPDMPNPLGTMPPKYTPPDAT